MRRVALFYLFNYLFIYFSIYLFNSFLYSKNENQNSFVSLSNPYLTTDSFINQIEQKPAFQLSALFTNFSQLSFPGAKLKQKGVLSLTMVHLS